MRALHLMCRVAAALIALFALSATVYTVSLVVTAFESPAPSFVNGVPNITVPISSTEPRPVAINGPLFGFSPELQPVNILVTLTGIDPDAQIASYTATMSMAQSLLLRMPGSRGGPAVTYREEELRVAPHAGALKLRILDDVGGLDRQVSIPVSEFVDANPVSISFSLPLRGDPSAFPNDWYQWAGDFVLWTPGKWVLTSPSGVGQPGVPLKLAFVAGPALRSFVVKIRSDRTEDGSALRLIVATNGETKGLAYITAVVPALLAVIAFFLLLGGSKARGSIVRRQELAFTVTLGVLAVLPIRFATVPSSLKGLTRIDALLALGVVLAVSVLLVALAIQIWTPAPADGDAS